jgi:hypothetical protein
MADLTLRLVKGSPLTKAEVDANFSNLNEAITTGGEPMGHADRAQSTLSFDAGTRTVSIAPVSGAFTVWVKGNKFVFTTAQTVVIPDTTGLHYVFFNASGVLSTRMAYFDWPNEAPTAYVAWNSATGAAPFFADERHGVTLDWQTHEYLHRTRGAALANGFSLGNYSVTGDGSSDAHAQLDLSGGTFFDEDLQVDITPSNTPTPNTWEQDLTGPAQIPVLFRSGTGWVRDTATNFVLKAGTATPRYNTESGGVWGLTDIPNNSYSAVWVIATNNLTYPVVAVMGQAVDSNAAQAENFEWSGLNLDGFPSVEFRPLYKIIFQCSTSYANTIKARFTKVFDDRNIVAASPAATIGSSHGGLSGLGADDHLQYLHITEVRSPSAAVKNSLLPTQTGNSGKFLSTDGANPSWATMTAPNNGTLTLATSGSGLSGSASFTADQSGNSTFTVSIASATANTVDTLVLRDASGNFAANIITANSFSGSASGLTGLKTVNGNSILGSGNIQIDGGVTSFNTRTGAITLSSLDVTTALGYTPYSSSNPDGYTSNVGTVTGVTAGTGLSGGTITSSGTLSLATSGVAAGTYTKVTVDVYGRATTGTSLSSSDVTTALGYTPPQPTGTGASGTWGISISGTAANASFLPQNDTRSTATTPQTINSGLRIDFKQNSTEGLSDGGDYFGQITYRQYGAGSDWSGGAAHQLGFTDNGNVWQRSGSGTTWGSWKKLLDSSNYTSYRGTQLVSPNGATVVAADSAMPDSGHSFIHTLGYGPSGNDGHILGMTWSGTTSIYGAQIWVDTDPNNRMAFRSRSSTGAWTGWNEVIHSSNYTSYSPSLSGNYKNLSVGGLYSRYNYNEGTYINDSTSAYALSPDYGQTTVAMHSSHGHFGDWATTLTMSGYERYGAYQISGHYNASTPSLAIRNYSQALGGWTAWVRLLSSSNYSSYALPLSGGTLTGRTNVNVNGRTTGYTGSNLEVFTSDNTPPGISFHRGGYSATLLYEIDGELYINAWTTRAQSGKLLSSGNYTSYVTPAQYLGTAATKAIAYNSNSISENITIANGQNAYSCGPITINNGYTITVQDGGVWTVI